MRIFSLKTISRLVISLGAAGAFTAANATANPQSKLMDEFKAEAVKNTLASDTAFAAPIPIYSKLADQFHLRNIILARQVCSPPDLLPDRTYSKLMDQVRAGAGLASGPW